MKASELAFPRKAPTGENGTASGAQQVKAHAYREEIRVRTDDLIS